MKWGSPAHRKAADTELQLSQKLSAQARYAKSERERARLEKESIEATRRFNKINAQGYSETAFREARRNRWL